MVQEHDKKMSKCDCKVGLYIIITVCEIMVSECSENCTVILKCSLQ